MIDSRYELYNEDCMETMQRYPDKHFDLAIVDPPYGIGEKLTSGGTWAAKYDETDQIWDVAPDAEYFAELFRVSRNQIIWGGNYFQLPPTRCFLIWDKVAHLPTMADCEFAWTSFDKNAKICKVLRSGNQTGEARIHICQKPARLYKWLLKNYANPGDKILDTHGGSMSSVIASLDMGFHIVCSELAPEYFSAGKRRVNEYLSQLKLFA